MPKELIEKLSKMATKKGFNKDRKNKYIYGTLSKLKKKGVIKE